MHGNVSSSYIHIITKTYPLTNDQAKNTWTLWELNPRPHAIFDAKRARYQLCQVPDDRAVDEKSMTKFGHQHS